jgi:hypothetical protein
MNRPIILFLLLCLSLPAASQTQNRHTPPKTLSGENAQIYRNATFGFRYEIPYAWVDRTSEMRDEDEPQKPDASAKPDNAKPSDTKDKDEKAKPIETKASAPGELLLAVFERPPDAIGDTINSAVVIASEPVAAYPGLKDAQDFIAPLTELTLAKGFKVQGDPSVLDIDTRQVICVDFTKPLNETLTMHQSTLILVAKGQILSFTFVAASQDEVDTLIDGLHFGAIRSRSK